MTALTRRRTAALPAGLLVVLLAACGGVPENGDDAPPPDPEIVLGARDVAVAELADVAAGVVITGTLQPSELVDVKAQVAGTIQNLRADRGVPVRRGRRLAIIEAEGIRSQVSGASAGVAAGRSAIAAAEANLAAARQRLEGARELYQAGAMSAVDYQAAEAQYEAALGQLSAAKAETAAAEAQLTAATETARRTTVEAPITGVVSARPVSEGEAVSVGQVLFTIVNSSVLELSGQVPVQQAALVRVGQEVSFTLDAYPGEVFTGTVARIDPVADPATRRVGVWLQLPNPEGRVVAGQFVTGEVVTANVRQAVTVPRSALREDEQGSYVLVVEDGRVVRRDVTLVPTTASAARAPIASGVAAGDRVIVSPAADIPVGARVRPETAPAPAPATQSP